MPVYIEKNGDLVGCHHSVTDERTNKQGRMRGLIGPTSFEDALLAYINVIVMIVMILMLVVII